MGMPIQMTVFVPKGAFAEAVIAPKSGIVGTAPYSGQLCVDYEGNLYGAVNLVTFADRVKSAAGRHQTRYPTVARAWFPVDTLVPVGIWDGQRVHVTDPERLAAWLGVTEIPDIELQTSS